jgi:hypothetical protein
MVWQYLDEMIVYSYVLCFDLVVTPFRQVIYWQANQDAFGGTWDVGLQLGSSNQSMLLERKQTMIWKRTS